MNHTRVSLRVHCIFTTKDRYDAIPDDLQPRMWEFIGGIARQLGMKAIAVGGTANHVHVLLLLPAAMPLSEAVQKLKANSSRWMHEVTGRRFFWQEGYGAFSIGLTQTDATVRYILGQREHHAHHTLEDELKFVFQKACA
jgi:putative transposase